MKHISYWNNFEKTGRITDYLNYTQNIYHETYNTEKQAGGELGTRVIAEGDYSTSNSCW